MIKLKKQLIILTKSIMITPLTNNKQNYNIKIYIETLKMSVTWFTKQVQKKDPIVKIPLQFYFEPVEIISKELTKLNCASKYRIHYLGPRWENSQALHKSYSKKHGYEFDERRINNNNTFLSESMCSNQFYRNQVYYRAFEGMNPTIDRETSLRFDSKFESGNLDCVVKVSQKQYDLFLRVDSNTRGHLFWFYYEVANAKPGTQIKFNICNMTKSISLYQKGFKPYSSVMSPNGNFQSWNQQSCDQVKIEKKNLRYEFVYEKIKVRVLHQLSFVYKFENQLPVRFAYCVPYTYTQMIREINQLVSEHVRVGVIGRTLTGVDIPIVQVGQVQENVDKPVIFAIGRAHPGQSNGSHTLSGFMKYICLSPQATYLRKKSIFLIVPMLNPDGVILGNSRTGASGKDLNREFKTRNKYLFPQVDFVKRLVYKVLGTQDIEMFLDFHGHSRKKNMFMFGPNYNITQPEYYKSRIMPKFLAQFTSIFRYYGCVYSIPPSKICTARAVMLNQMGIPYVYTVQTSVGQYYDYEDHKNKPLSSLKFSELGANISKAIQMYLQSIEQYQQYIAMKRQQIQPVQPPIKKKPNQKPSLDSQKPSQAPLNITISNSSQVHRNYQSTVQKFDKKKNNIKDLRFLKILQQIKSLEDNRANKKKEENVSDASSDSQDEKDNLEKNKMMEFQGMVTQCIQTENLKQKRCREMKSISELDGSPKNTRKPRRNIGADHHMKQLLKNLQKNEIKFTPYHRQTKSLQTKAYKSQPKTLIITKQQMQEEGTTINGQQLAISETLIYKFESQKKNMSKFNKLNLKMFNFSEMIEEPLPRNIMTCSRQKRERYMNNNITHIIQPQKIFSESKNKVPEDAPKKNKGFTSKYYKMNLQPTLLDEQDESHQKFSNKNHKQKGIFPAPFYRIKYQNYQKKKQKIFEDKEIMLVRADQDIEEIRNVSYQKSNVLRSKKRGIGFLDIRRVRE